MTRPTPSRRRIFFPPAEVRPLGERGECPDCGAELDRSQPGEDADVLVGCCPDCGRLCLIVLVLSEGDVEAILPLPRPSEFEL